METIQSDAAFNSLSLTIEQVPTAIFGANGSHARFASATSPVSMNLFASSESPMALRVTSNPPLTRNIDILFPPLSGDTNYQAIMNENDEAVGGKYNPINNKIIGKIKNNGTYILRHNRKDFTDILAKTAEMQDAINILAAKGVINGTTDTTFSPDSPINRAEIAALLTRVLSVYDANEDGGFIDVLRADWFFGAAGSAKRYNLMSGVTETTFAPLLIIPKDQIIVVSARVLREDMRYKDPVNIISLLNIYQDADSLADWSRTDIALATREDLIPRRTDGLFSPNAQMTRGDAAIVLYRLYEKIW